MMQGAKHLLLNAVFTSREQAFCGKRFKTFDHHATAHFYRRHLAHRTGAIAGIQPQPLQTRRDRLRLRPTDQ